MKLIALWILGLGIAASNVAFWMYVMRGGQERFRLYVERRYDVAISSGLKGHWRVSGSGSRLRDLGIELLQLAYFVGAFVIWAVALLLVLALLSRFSAP